jgi:hypothetical protein
MLNYFLRSIFCVGISTTVFSLYSQAPTVGLVFKDPSASDAYTLFSPDQNNKVYLINSCGEKVKQWTFTDLPAATCYLLPNGNLLRAGQDSLQIHDWNDNLVWSYDKAGNGLSQNHDIEPLPNGNILCIVNDVYSKASMVSKGKNPSLSAANVKLNAIVEIQPSGLHGGTIVWQWKFMDHFIQDYDAGKPNYGVVANHPELIDINFDNGELNDWTHCNAVDYNAALDQVMLTSRHLSEIYIIDHSTTMAEAAGHTGGLYNHGGDPIWRWGNPQVYRQGTAADQKLFKQHDSKWVEPGYLDDGKISVFNNGGDGTYTFSSVHLLTPVLSSNSYSMTNGKYLPQNFDWSWNGSVLGTVMNEGKKCGVISLPNGNVVISQASNGVVSEIDKSGIFLWNYKNPDGQSLFTQGTVIPSSANSLFKAEKYPTTFPGFVGKNLSAIGLIEDYNSISASCALSTGLSNIEKEELFFINPVANGNIEFGGILKAEKICIFNIEGQLVFSHQNFSGNSLKINLSPGMYYLQIQSGTKIVNKKFIIQ